MSVAAGYAPPISGPSEARITFLRKVGVFTFLALAISGVIAVVSTFTVAPAVYSMGRWGALVAILGSFMISHYVARKMVYGGAKIPGFILAVVFEGISFGFLLLSTISYMPIGGNAEQAFIEGIGIIAKAMAITAASGLGMLVYVWFNKSELNMVKAGLSILGLPMLVLMVLQFVFPIGGTLGLIICAVFVVASGAALLYRLNSVVHEYDENQHIEAAYEISMALLVLLWNVISLLNRLRR
ncbi:MAG: Bax inhibitor-1 family protein [Deltaproteobacteria bacterium]|nr:Bax inhibitor-1 family protein [Deltaproteobacteria bacterium]